MSTVVGTKYELTCPHGKIKNPETYQQLVCLPFRQIGLEPPGNRQCSGKYHKQLAGYDFKLIFQLLHVRMTHGQNNNVGARGKILDGNLQNIKTVKEIQRAICYIKDNQLVKTFQKVKLEYTLKKI